MSQTIIVLVNGMISVYPLKHVKTKQNQLNYVILYACFVPVALQLQIQSLCNL